MVKIISEAGYSVISPNLDGATAAEVLDRIDMHRKPENLCQAAESAGKSSYRRRRAKPPKFETRQRWEPLSQEPGRPDAELRLS